MVVQSRVRDWSKLPCSAESPTPYVRGNAQKTVIGISYANGINPVTGKKILVKTRAVKGSKPFVQFSSKAGISKGGQRVFSHQARFPKSNLNIRLDRGFRSPLKGTSKFPYLGKPYNGFNTHINIQKPGSFNYHIPLNPLKWKYYKIP